VIHLLLFFATLASTWLAGALSSGVELPSGMSGTAMAFSVLKAGLPYCASIMGILLTHEMGHYLVARSHRVDATLPYFLPLPGSPFGTLGAFIRIRSALPSRLAVLDIGAAGPVAGFLVALPLLIWGYAHSEVVTSLPAPPARPFSQSAVALALDILKGGPSQPASTEMLVMGDNLISWLATRWTHGPLPPGSDLRLGPVAFAAWIGMYVTALNLIPIGQLDGGHVLYALFGRHAESLSRLFAWALFAMGLFAFWGWLVWWLLVRLLVKVQHPPAASEAPLTPGRRALGIAAFAVLVLTFIPVPFYQ
jgi:membrane-associated protease RseP (regulator of RpoE activity)